MTFDIEPIWLASGFAGQALFSARFIVQWVMSERVGKSVIPLAFWLFSVAGGVTLLASAILRAAPVIIAGQAGGLVVYARNLWLIRKERRAAQ